MKKLLLLIVTLLFVFTLSACGEDVPTLDVFTDLETTVADNNAALEASVTALETALDALEASLTTLQGDSDAADALIVALTADIATINAALVAVNAELDGLDSSIVDITADLTAINVLIVGLQSSIDALQVEIGDAAQALQVQINPLYLLETEVTQIIIAHTNDVHGRVNADSWAGSMGMATIKNIVDALRATYDNTFLIDAGDMFHGTTFATLETGESMVDVMNQVGYDLMVPGNHDFDYGQDRLLELEALADFPMISANIQYASDDTDFMNPYYIQDFDGVSVGFFGITSPETVYKTHPDNVIGLNFLDPITQAALMVAELDPLVDIIIMVAHVGLDGDTLITTEDIAIAVPGIDVIIDGHSHSTLPDGMMVNDTLIVSTGEYMKNLGVFSLSVQDGEIIGYDVMLIDADKAEALAYGDDADVQAYIDAIVDEQAIILDEVVGQTAVELMGERDYVRTGETNLGNIITDAMIISTGADVAITNGGGIRASIPTGDVTLGDVITVLPFGNIIVTIELTGQELLDSLEYGTSSYPDASGKFPHVAGMTFTIDTTAPEGSRVIDLEIDGTPVDLVATYVVATNDFLAAGGDGYEIFATKARIGEFNGLHEALEDMFTVGTDIAMPVMGRVNTILTVAAGLALEDDVEFTVKGIVSGFNGSSNMVIQDADGTAIVIYGYSFMNANDFALGDEIIVSGTRDTYYGLNELVSPVLVEVVSTGNAVTVFNDILVADIVADMAGHQGFNVELTGLIVVELDNGFGYATVKDALDNEIVFKLSAVSYAEYFWAVDDVIDLSVIVYDVYYDENRVIVYEYAGLSDVDALDYVSTNFEVVTTTTENIDFILTDGEFGVDFVWTSSNEAVITELGVVTQPLFGEADVDVTLTIVYTIGIETISIDYVVTVPAPAAAFVAVGTEIFISEYIEGSGNNKAIELFNPTADAITLDGYVINVYSNGSLTAGNTLDLTGVVIEAGGVYVIYNSGAVLDITSVGDVAATVTYFNGDDAVELVKDGTVIDVIGLVGEDPGSSWVVGDGSTGEHTITRNSDVTGPNAVFTPAEWTAFDQDTFDYLGSHVTD